jgi:hypothetical protein
VDSVGSVTFGGPSGRRMIYDELARSGELRVIDGFFHELRRYG